MTHNFTEWKVEVAWDVPPPIILNRKAYLNIPQADKDD